jgi:hypothetical protein
MKASIIFKLDRHVPVMRGAPSGRLELQLLKPL